MQSTAGLLKILCSASPFKKVFSRRSLMDSLDVNVNDICKRPIRLQKHLYLVCQTNLCRDPKIILRGPKWVTTRNLRSPGLLHTCNGLVSYYRQRINKFLKMKVHWRTYTEPSPERFQEGGFAIVRGVFSLQNYPKLHLFIVFHVSIWGAWSYVWGS